MNAAIGPRPELAWVVLDLLDVDERYQRAISSERGQDVIERLARDFHWRRFQPPTLTPREGGRYAVLDGQHRVEAAKIVGLGEVPAYVVATDSLAEEADSFVAINGGRVQVNPFQMHHAKLVAGDPDALAIKAACDKAGVIVPRYPIPKTMMKPRVTMALTTIRDLLKSHGEVAAVAALETLADAFPARGGEIRALAIRALSILFKADPGLDRRGMISALVKRPPEKREHQAAITASDKGIRRVEAFVQALARDYGDWIKRAERAAGATAKGFAPGGSCFRDIDAGDVAEVKRRDLAARAAAKVMA